jgi:prepilin-type N-terminal cleavage/methylation domain-containing protein
MKKSTRENDRYPLKAPLCFSGFTLIELLVVIAIIAILAGIILPVLARSKMKARITQDLNHLHEFGRAATLWAQEHEGRYPWRVDVNEGGSMNSSEWAEHMRAMSKELVTMDILICPFDKDKRLAPDWASLAGFDNVSYFIGLNSEQSRLTMLSGDAAFIGGGGGVDPFWNASAGSSIDATWENVHAGRGNVVLSDGSVHSWNSRQFREQIALEIATGSTNVVLSKPQGTL